MKPAAILRTLAAAAAGPIALGLIAPRAGAQTPPPPDPRVAARPETISVTGVGRAMVTPDRVSFTAGVETSAPTLQPALEENSRRMAAVIEALKKAGVGEKELRTSHVAVNPQMDYQEGRRPRILGYAVSNSVAVTRGDVSGVGRLMQAAIDAGSNQVSGLSFTVADPARGREPALRAAVLDARSKAETLAEAAGRQLGRALSITEGGLVDEPRPMFRTQRAEVAAAPDVPVESGAEELRFTVTVVFELR